MIFCRVKDVAFRVIGFLGGLGLWGLRREVRYGQGTWE